MTDIDSCASLPLSPADLEALLRTHGVNDLGVALVRQIRTGPPARTVAGAGGYVTGRYPSRKMGRTIQYESRTVELAFVLACEIDQDVREYYDQPAQLTLSYPSANGRRVVTGHTPDFFVLSASFAGFVECKPAEKLPELVQRSPSRYVRADGGAFACPPGEEEAARYGLAYKVWSPPAHSAVLTDNARFLEAEWGRSTRTFPDADVERLRGAVRARPGVTLDALVHELGDPDLVHWAVFHTRVYVDLGAAFLSHPDRVHVFESAAAARLWQAGMDSVDASGSGFAPDEVLRRSLLAQYPERALQIALERYRVLRPDIEARLPALRLSGPKRATRMNWLKSYRRAQRECGVGLVGLCPKWHLAGNRTLRFPAETLALMDAVAEDEYETERNVTAKAAHAVLMDRCLAAATPFPSYPTFLRYLKSRKRDRSVARRRGRKEAAAQAPAAGPRDPAVVGQAPMDTVHIDHTRLDILIRYGPSHDEVLERPWLTLVLCSWSRCVVGYDLSFDAPSIHGLFTALRDTFDRQGRMPNRVVVDRGPEFGSVAFDQLCAACDVLKVERPPGRPRFGSVVERAFLTVNTQIVHLLRGNTQLRKDPRRMSREVAPEREAVWSLPDFDDMLQRFIFEDYPSMPHAGLNGMTPRERFEQGRALMGSGRTPSDTQQSDIRFLLWPPAKRGRATVHPRKGIVVDCVHYWHEAMRSSRLAGTKVDVRVDPHDAGYVVAWLDSVWRLCRAEHFESFHGRSRREVRLATLVLRQRHRDELARQPVRAHRLAALLRDVRAHEALVLQRRRDAERRELLDRSGLRDAVAPSATDEPDISPCTADDGWADLSLDDLPPGVLL